MRSVKYLFVFCLVILIWALLPMIYFDRYPPFLENVFSPLLTPWKGLRSMPAEGGLVGRLAYMQSVLDGSKRVASASFLAMTVSFAFFTGYLVLIYQQKQRRSRENELLQLKNQEIARRNEFIRYISATIGHEFKNNLARIKRRIDLLAELPEDMKERLDNNLDKLFSDIDIFKKISDERETGLIDFETVDLKKMLTEIADQYEDLIDTEFYEPVGPPVIYASTALLRTVFENIFDNAVKYRKNDHGKARVMISFGVDIDGRRRYLSISLRDQGIGMDEARAEQCFYKGKSSGDGWGEGLYFSKYVIGLHAGKIKTGKEYTAPGVGTEILIYLPYVEEDIDV